MTKDSLLGLEVNVQGDIWVLAKYVVEITADEIDHEDGSISRSYTYLKYSETGTGWYRFYERNKTRESANFIQEDEDYARQCADEKWRSSHP